MCTNGVQDLVTLPDDSIVVGGGDGNFVRIIGRDMSWQKTQEASCRFPPLNPFLN